ncbi:hypothetical protein LTR53_002735 [Teratosphaeriaceae sp. CCFEE 6253]|nr:hypothetical protein LTR53_002735 [Teratosphaeriaceae sp. CCFEE 6253]
MTASERPKTVHLHGRTYRLPTRPTVVVCVDGFDPEYLTASIKDNSTPTLARWTTSGFHATAQSAMPSVTNTNNLSIITGAPFSVHGVSGNYYLDKATGQEHIVLDDATMWGSTILAQMAEAGVRVAAVTAKDKLRRVLNHGLSPAKGSVCFSAQKADEATLAEHGIQDVETWLGQAAPSMYSGDLSIFVLDAGVKLLQEGRADLFYLTLSDFIQHKHAPGSAEVNDFMRKLDARLAALEEAGAVVAVTGDHGMSAKSDAHGSPNVLFLEDILNERWPEAGARVICPIADPFVKHHGALGGFVRAHLLKSNAYVDEMVEACRKLPQVEVAMRGAEAAKLYEMPLEREGDLVVITKGDAVVGAKKSDHDLSQLEGHHLRSHGGLSEQAIPIIRSSLLANRSEADGRAWRNFDVFELALNL